jgi:hypothetical protein
MNNNDLEESLKIIATSAVLIFIGMVIGQLLGIPNEVKTHLEVIL